MPLLRTLKTLTLSSLVLLASCRPPNYLPAGLNVPLLREKGEINLSAGTGTAGNELKTSYALTEHIGLMGDYSDRRRNMEPDSFSRRYFSGHLGAGYFRGNGENVNLEIFGGAGFGTGRGGIQVTPILSRTELNMVDFRYTRLFLQTNVGLSRDLSRSHSDVQFFGALRVDYDRYSRFNETSYREATRTPNQFGWDLAFRNELLSPNVLKMEFQLGCRVGTPNIQFYSLAGFGSSVRPVVETIDGNQSMAYMHFSFGINLRLFTGAKPWGDNKPGKAPAQQNKPDPEDED